MKYDDYKWHLGDDFPSELKPKSALTHIGMFMGWVIDKDFVSETLKERFPKELQKFRNREITGADFLELCSDYKLVSEDLNKEANNFAKSYYETNLYFDDYVDLSDDSNETIFHETDSWEKYERIKEIIEKRYQEWK